MFKESLSVVIATAMSIFLLSGCSNTPKPSAGKEKPTVFIQSLSEEKFKDLTEETAIWRGISPYYVKDKAYLQCDMTPEIVGLFYRNGFEIVHNLKDADYKIDVELNACSSKYLKHDEYYTNNIKETNLYKDFIKWVNKNDASEIPKDVKEIATLISNNESDGYKRFYQEKYIQKYGNKFGGFISNWSLDDKLDQQYFIATKGVLFPQRFSEMKEDEKNNLSDFYKSIEGADKAGRENHYISGVNMFGGGAGMVGNFGSGSAGGNLGLGFMAVGALMSSGTGKSPTPYNILTITNLKTKKMIKMKYDNNIHAHSNWNSKMVEYKRYIFKEIPWKDLD